MTLLRWLRQSPFDAPTDAEPVGNSAFGPSEVIRPLCHVHGLPIKCKHPEVST